MRFREQLRHEFPRISFPTDADEFQRMAALGLELASVHLLEDARLITSPVRLEGNGGAPLSGVAGAWERSTSRRGA